MRITRHPLLSGGAALRNIPLDEGVIQRLERSFRLIDSVAPGVVRSFHQRLERTQPALGARFGGDASRLEEHGRALVDSLRLVIANLRRFDTVKGHLHELGRRYAPTDLRSMDCAAAIRELVAAMSDALGPAFTAEQEQEWVRALELMAAMVREGAGQTVSGFATLSQR